MEDITAQCVYIDMFSLVFKIYINTINWVSLQYLIDLSHSLYKESTHDFHKLSFVFPLLIFRVIY